MLVLSRSEGERICIGNDITIHVVRFRNGRVRIGIEAPQDVAIVRDEIKDSWQDALRRDLEPAGTPGTDVLG